MFDFRNVKTISNGWRIFLVILALAPLLFWRQFYDHFYAYLTGTVINEIIKDEWRLVAFFIVLFMLFAIPLTYRKRSKWIDYGLVGAFFISLFVEMYGLPLTILFAAKYFFVPNARLPENLLVFNFLGVGIGMDHAMVYGSLLMIIGMLLITFGWWSLYHQSKLEGFARSGIYSVSRHPQYLGFIMLILGWLYGWPTLLTIVLSPLLIYKYVKAAMAEEKDMKRLFAKNYADYASNTSFLI